MPIADSLFDQFWNRTVPYPFALDPTLKNKARAAWNMAIDELAKASGTPAGVASLTAFLKIGQMLQEAKFILEQPTDPASVVAAVQMLLDRVKAPAVPNPTATEPHP